MHFMKTLFEIALPEEDIASYCLQSSSNVKITYFLQISLLYDCWYFVLFIVLLLIVKSLINVTHCSGTTRTLFELTGVFMLV